MPEKKQPENSTKTRITKNARVTKDTKLQKVTKTPPIAGSAAPKPAKLPSATAREKTPAARPRTARPTAVAPPIATPAPAPARVATSEPLSILMVTPEAHPFAKTGGLAEVAGALPDALADLGHGVTVVMPRYRGVEGDAGGKTLTFSMGSHTPSVRVVEHVVRDGVTFAFVDAPELFDRDGLYGDSAGDYPDNAWRFAVLARAALEYARQRGERPSVIHAHDWQTGLVPVYQKMLFTGDPVVGGVPVIFTIHNLAFQGVFPASVLSHVGLGWDVMHVQAMEYWGQVSFLKGGINFSEKITTVSPGYAREIVRPELGFGLDGVLARRAADLVGILNGIDVARWNPSKDPFVAAAFSAEDLEGKREAKRLLLDLAGLPGDDRALARPLIGLVSRLTDQKGFDLIAAATNDLMDLDASWVMLGSGERPYEDQWRGLAARFPDRVAATIGFDERLAHHIEAGADIFLMPSRFEPCGLNQMYSLRYGTIPVVRATGGLDDTVEDFDERTGRGTGFKFAGYDPPSLLGAVRRALSAYRNPELWRRMQVQGMQQDHSWNASAREYVKVYRMATGRERQPVGVVSDRPLQAIR
jgi:starch synthase